MTKDYEEKIRAAVEKVAAAVAGGSIRTLAHMLGVSSQAIYKWIKVPSDVGGVEVSIFVHGHRHTLRNREGSFHQRTKSLL